MGKLDYLGKLVFLAIKSDDTGARPLANEKRQRGQLWRQTFGENEQLLLTLEEFVENENRDTGDCESSQNQKPGEEHFSSENHDPILPMRDS